MKALFEIVRMNVEDVVTASGGGCTTYDCPADGGGLCPGDD